MPSLGPSICCCISSVATKSTSPPTSLFKPLYDQFVEAISSWEEMDLEIAGDFILMAATLLEIKARMIRPPVETEEEDDDEKKEFVDPRADLIQQLLAYRDTKEAGKVLEAWKCSAGVAIGEKFRESIPDDPDEAEGVDLNNADPFALFSAWEKVLESIAGNGPRTVVFNDIPIDQRVKQLEVAMRASGEARLDWLLQQEERPIQKLGCSLRPLRASAYLWRRCSTSSTGRSTCALWTKKSVAASLRHCRPSKKTNQERKSVGASVRPWSPGIHPKAKKPMRLQKRPLKRRNSRRERRRSLPARTQRSQQCRQYPDPRWRSGYAYECLLGRAGGH